MKQTIFMIAMTLIGTVGLFRSVLCGVFVYYLFAVMRPQFLWWWALPYGVQWSMYVAVPTIGAVLLHRLSVPSQTRQLSGAHLLVALFFVWISLSYVTAYSREAAWLVYLDYIKIMTMFMISALALRRVRDLWRLMILAALALSYIAYEVNFSYFGTASMSIYHQGYGGLDNNGAGLMLAMGIPLCLYAYLGSRHWWRWVFALSIPILLHAVLMTYSRGAMVSLLVAAPLMFLRRRHRGQLAMAALAVALAVPVLAGQEIRERFFSVERYEEDGSAQSRFDSWRAAFRMALDYPISGVGVRNANLLSHQYGADLEGRTIHNQYLQILADSGFPALGFYLLTFGAVALGTRRVRRQAYAGEDEESRQAYSVACGVEGSLAVFMIGGMFLSLEVFELPWLLLLLGAQLPLAFEHTPAAATVPATAATARVAA